MKIENQNVKECFYEECAELLGVPHIYKPWGPRRPDRWNNRHPGNGRFDGYGIIRMYGPNNIHVCLRSPKHLNKVFASTDDALMAIRALLN